jgi:flagellar hook capping protein FlgD
MKVALSKLNAEIPIGHSPIGVGSVLWGLRGLTASGPGSRDPLRDITRGGTNFTFPSCGPTPTLLSRFDAEDTSDGILLQWAFTDPGAFASVELERAIAAEGPWTTVAVERGQRGGAITALDRDVRAGQTWFYRLVAGRADGTSMTFGPISGVHGIDASAPVATFLGRPSPNPFSTGTTVRFQVAKPGFVELSVLDAQGRRVRTIQAGTLAPGSYTRSWDGQNDRFGAAPAGVYFMVLHTVDGKNSQRLALTR